MVHTKLAEDIDADVPVDLAIDEDRQVSIGADKDLAQTVGLDNVAQSLVISLGNVLRPLIGEPVTPSKIDSVEDRVRRVLQNEVQISDIEDVSVSEINSGTNTVVFDVRVGYNNTFELPVEL